MMMRAVVCVVAGAAASSGFAQPSISQADVLVFGAAVNTNDQIDDYFLSAGDPSAGLVMFSETAQIDEPLTAGGAHSVGGGGEFEAIGSAWTGEGTVVARFAPGLDPTVDVPGNGVGGVTFVQNTVDFTLASPTPVRFEAGATANVFGPGDAFVFDGLGLDLNADDGTDLLDASLTDFMTGGVQTLDEVIVLPAGSYSFAAFASASAAETLGVQIIAVNYAFSVTFIPSPATAAILGLAALAGARRQRDQQ